MESSPSLSERRLPRRSVAAILIFLLMGFAVLFVAPFHLPVAPAISDSYLFGFNNRAALGIFLIFVAAFAWWSGGMGLVARGSPAVQSSSRRPLFVVLTLTTIFCIGCWLVYRKFGIIIEGEYEMDRLLQLMSGGRPYRDFEYIYGPFLLYFPAALHWVFGLSLRDAYLLSWTVEWLAGVYALWLTVQWACDSSPRRNGIFLLAWAQLAMLMIALGTHYTPLRYVSAPFFAALTWRVLSRRGLLPAVSVALAGAAWTLGYSPEQGVAFIFGTLAFLVLLLWQRRSGVVVPATLFVMGAAALLAMYAHAGVFLGAKAAASGGLNFPLLPGIAICITLFLLLVAGCALVNSLRLQRAPGALEYMTLVALCALPAAFGRCDSGHLTLSPLGAYLAAWTVLSYHRLGGRWMVLSLFTFVGLPLNLYQSNDIVMFPLKAALFSPGNPVPGVRKASMHMLERVLGPQRAGEKVEKWRSQFLVYVAPVPPPSEPYFVPFGVATALLPLEDTSVLTNGRFVGFTNLLQPSQVQEKIDELRVHPKRGLLFAEGPLCPAVDAPPATEAELEMVRRERRRQLWINTQAFYVPQIKNAPPTFLNGVCAYISAHYVPDGTPSPIAGGQIWRPKD